MKIWNSLPAGLVGAGLATLFWAVTEGPTPQEQNTMDEGKIAQFHRAVAVELASEPGGYKLTALKPTFDGLGFDANYGTDSNPDMVSLRYSPDRQMCTDRIQVWSNREEGPAIIEDILENNTPRLPKWLPDTTPY